MCEETGLWAAAQPLPPPRGETSPWLSALQACLGPSVSGGPQVPPTSWPLVSISSVGDRTHSGALEVGVSWMVVSVP